MSPRVGLALVGLVLAMSKLWRYQAGRRAGTIPPNPRLRRAGRVLGIALVCSLLGLVLLPLRIERDWPRWLFYPFFALMLVGVGCIYYGAFLFWGAKTEATDSDRGQPADER
jgi:uncharacterized membrane protein